MTYVFIFTGEFGYEILNWNGTRLPGLEVVSVVAANFTPFVYAAGAPG